MPNEAQPKEQLAPSGAWMGIAFVVLFVAGFLAFPTPEQGTSNAEWDGWWNDSGHRVGAVIGAYLMVLGLLAFVWFVWSLHRRLVDSGPMVIFGSLFVGLGMTSALIRASIAGAKQFGDTPVPSGDFARQFDQVGFGLLLVAGALSAGAFLAVVSRQARLQDLLPRWLTTAGYVVAASQIAASAFLPFALFPLWVLVASVVLVRRRRVTDEIALTDQPV